MAICTSSVHDRKSASKERDILGLLVNDMCRDHGDGTERREAATDAEDEEETGAEQGEIVQTAGPAAESSAPVPASPQSSLAEPPGFSPTRAPGSTSSPIL